MSEGGILDGIFLLCQTRSDGVECGKQDLWRY